jgi:hypothetical protein
MAKPPEIMHFQRHLSSTRPKYSESELNHTVSSSTPEGELNTHHILQPGSNNENKLIILNSFHIT